MRSRCRGLGTSSRAGLVAVSAIRSRRPVRPPGDARRVAPADARPRHWALSVEEVCYRKPDLSEGSVRYHLRELEERGVVDGLEIPRGERTRKLPNTSFAVAEEGPPLLRRANLDEELGVWKTVYDRLERTDRIEGMEERPTADRYGADVVPDELGTHSASTNESDRYGRLGRIALKTPSYRTFVFSSRNCEPWPRRRSRSRGS